MHSDYRKALAGGSSTSGLSISSSLWICLSREQRTDSWSILFSMSASRGIVPALNTNVDLLPSPHFQGFNA